MWKRGTVTLEGNLQPYWGFQSNDMIWLNLPTFINQTNKQALINTSYADRQSYQLADNKTEHLKSSLNTLSATTWISCPTSGQLLIIADYT